MNKLLMALSTLVVTNIFAWFQLNGQFLKNGPEWLKSKLFVFLIGAPLGIIAKRGGFALSMALSLGFFVIYWGFLIAGEELADRGMISPFFAMWQPNIALGIIGTILCIYISREQYLLKLDWLNIKNYWGKNSDS